MLKTRFLVVFAAHIGLSSAVLAQPDEPSGVPSGTTVGEVERLDPAIDKLIPSGAVIEVLADGFDWSEGPVWSARQQAVLFSDIPRNSIYRWSQADGLSLHVTPSGYTGSAPRGGESGSNGLTLNAAGDLVLCQHGDRRIAELPSRDGVASTFNTIASKYEGKRFNSPNDLAIHSSGAIYFTDPPYGLEQGPDDPARELDYCGVYRVATDGTVTLLTDKLERPNGIAFSPDEKTLYVAQSWDQRPVVMAYGIEADGTIDDGRVFFDAMKLSKTRRGMPDGLKVDKSGNLFATGPGGVLVLDKTGKHLGSIRTGELIANCAFGDDGRTLYMTSDRYLCRIKLTTTGCGF